MTDRSIPRDWLDREEEVLAPYAMRTRASRGRRHGETTHPYRTAYQRDRDRIVHSTAFRRLMYKTQVLVNQYSDHHRTRLTHTLEVAQISRTIARRLGLNEDLTEAIALAHDLGHPPFGHAGEEALDQCMAGHGGFEHNRHGLRIVEQLEYRYPSFPGLNLTWEVRESLALHSKRRDDPELEDYRTVGRPLLEQQVVDTADSLAYDTHDIDDALSVGLLRLDDLKGVEIWRRTADQLRERFGPLPEPQFQPAMIRSLIDWQVSDLLEFTCDRLEKLRIKSVEQVRQMPDYLVSLSPELMQLKGELEEFLRLRVYRHHRVVRMSNKAQRFVVALFEQFCQLPEMLPETYFGRIDMHGLHRSVCDYLAGMTDRYAQDEYQRLFHPYQNV